MKEKDLDRGRFITLEGGEGVGKTTNLSFITELLKANGNQVLLTREPGGTQIGEAIRSLLLDSEEYRMEGLTELLMIFAARSEHIKRVITPALERGTWVVCDRFTDATYAYQGGGRGVSTAVIDQLAELVQDDLWPDLTIYLDASVAISAKRIANRSLDRIENENKDFFERVRDTYLKRAKLSSRVKIVDANSPLEQVQRDIREVIAVFIGLES